MAWLVILEVSKNGKLQPASKLQALLATRQKMHVNPISNRVMMHTPG
jgi:hypothetical protein